MTDTGTATLVCPKCAGAMRNYERSGVVIDQCQECRGVYLDRGELERLITAEEQAYGVPPRQNPSRDSNRDRDSGYSSGDHGSGHGSSKHGSTSGNKKRRGGFLGELFD